MILYNVNIENMFVMIYVSATWIYKHECNVMNLVFASWLAAESYVEYRGFANHGAI